ncbi:MAG: hypothetical protein ACIAQ0_00995 [Phycisphaerales bacterium JB058]
MSSQQQSVSRAAIVMFLYAALILTFGIMAYLIAPPGANAKTAVVVTAICAVVMSARGVMTLMIHKKRNIGMIGIHVGLLLPLIFASLFLMRAGSNYRASGVYNYFQNAYQADLDDRKAEDTTANRDSFLSGAKPESGDEIPTGDKGYLGFILTMLFGVSVAAFVVLLLSRPKLPPKPAAAPEPVTSKPNAESSSAPKSAEDDPFSKT